MDWAAVRTSLCERGFALGGRLLDHAECASLVRTYDEAGRFRKRIVMAQHGYGSGEYQYFSYPLPPLVERLRRDAFPHLAAIADEWAERFGRAERYPGDLDAYLARCHEAGQTRPTPLLLKYGPGDYNRLHQDLYGELVFPIQMTVVLSAEGQDFEGGEFVLVEQRPRMQSRAHVLHMQQGDVVFFAVREFPHAGPRGFHRVKLRHGVGELRRGERFALGIIFHDAS